MVSNLKKGDDKRKTGKRKDGKPRRPKTILKLTQEILKKKLAKNH